MFFLENICRYWLWRQVGSIRLCNQINTFPHVMSLVDRNKCKSFPVFLIMNPTWYDIKHVHDLDLIILELRIKSRLHSIQKVTMISSVVKINHVIAIELITLSFSLWTSMASLEYLFCNKCCSHIIHRTKKVYLCKWANTHS